MSVKTKFTPWVGVLLMVGLSAHGTEIINDDLEVDGEIKATGVIGANFGSADALTLSSGVEVLDGQILIRNSATAPRIDFEDDVDGDSFRVAFPLGYNRLEIGPKVTGSWWTRQTFFMSLNGEIGMGTSANLGHTTILQRPADVHALGLTSYNRDEVTLGFYHENLIGASIEVSEDNATTDGELKIRVADVAGGTLATSAEFHPGGNVIIGSGVPGAKLEVDGNIIADDPTAAGHVATRGWLEAGTAELDIKVPAKGGISMGAFTNP